MKPSAAYNKTQMVLIVPPAKGVLFQEAQQSGSIREFLFQMNKDGVTYWVGAAVPEGTTDFTKVQVFFHPTVVQAGTVHAADSDYKTFTGGWSGSLQRYVAMQGGQLAGARKTTLIVPFMTMAAYTGSATSYMFATSSTQTLNAIMTAVRDAATGAAGSPIQVSKLGVSSFSSGIGAMRLFINKFGSAITETVDFDSPFIIGEPQVVTRAPGAPGRVYTQVSSPFPQPGWMTLPPPSFKNIQTYRDKGTHAQIGWMTYYLASIASVIA